MATGKDAASKAGKELQFGIDGSVAAVFYAVVMTGHYASARSSASRSRPRSRTPGTRMDPPSAGTVRPSPPRARMASAVSRAGTFIRPKSHRGARPTCKGTSAVPCAHSCIVARVAVAARGDLQNLPTTLGVVVL
jgi:hypothetical protein